MKSYWLAVKAIIQNDARQSLLLRRSNINKRFAGCWEWPGGKVDHGEDFVTALLRETLEETGYEIEVIGFAGATEFEMPSAHVVLLCMNARITGGHFRLSEEHDAGEWVAFPDMGNRLLCGTVGDFMRRHATNFMQNEA